MFGILHLKLPALLVENGFCFSGTWISDKLSYFVKWVFLDLETISGDIAGVYFFVGAEMMSMTCHNLEFGRTRLDFVACGCSSNASLDRFSVKNSANGALRSINRGYRAPEMRCFRRDIGRSRVFSTKTPETLLNGKRRYIVV